MEVVRTEHGWGLKYNGATPETRYQPIPPRVLRRLKQKAEADYRIQRDRRELQALM